MSTHIQTSETTANSTDSTFTPAQWRALQDLRARYSATGDHLSQSELERLQFVCWLYRTGRLVP